MPYFVYILYSETQDTFYRGHTKDLGERMERHNAGREKSTTFGKPWVLIWYTLKPNRGEAQILERKLKHLSRKRLIEFMEKYDQFYLGGGKHRKD